MIAKEQYCSQVKYRYNKMFILIVKNQLSKMYLKMQDL